MNANSKIGIFDSGIGGVTVLKEILQVLPKENYMYYSDSINNPYGDKLDSEINRNCEKIVQFLIENDCKAIVIACNTATAKSAEYLRKKYKNIPIIGIEPGYKMVYDNAKNGETLIMATAGTSESEKFHKLYDKYNNHKTTILSCSGLAELIEKDDKENLEKYLQNLLGKYRGEVQNIVLGCTHYPLIKKEIANVVGKVNFFDGSKGVADQVKNVLEKSNFLNNNGTGSIIFKDSSKSKDKEIRFYNILNGGKE